MRIIGTLKDERLALLFSQFLQQKKIPHQIEIQTNTDWESTTYGSSLCQIWIYEEDNVEEATTWLKLLQENPQDPIFLPPNAPMEEQEEPYPQTPPNLAVPPTSPPQVPFWERQPMGWVTRSLLAICCLLFFASRLLAPTIQVPERYAGLVLFTSPIERVLLYDFPKFYELLDRLIKLYGYEALNETKDLPKEGHMLLQQINQTPFWSGIYPLLIKGGLQGVKKGFQQYPTFEKIKEGQLWRLFSPCLLHADIFHLFFNMLWLIVLGKQIEQRMLATRYILFILIVGIVSNTAQYLMSGPNFIGFSGILCGMLAFIWTRQKVAAWEAYQIDRLTLIFMLIFILGLAAVQLLSFFLEKSFDLVLSPNIANMAHLTGGIMGFILGRMNFFSWRQA